MRYLTVLVLFLLSSKILAQPNTEVSPEHVVQKQVDSYNSGDLDAFVNCYSKNVVVRNFPMDTLYVGHERMRKNYSGLSPEKKVYSVEVTKRIVIGNKVIDEEKVTGNGKTQMQVALYEVSNGAISSMTFIFDDRTAPNPETIVQKQLDAYNSRDIDAFMKTYSEDVQLYNFPAEKRSQGQVEMRTAYAGYFESTPDLHCEIKNRMVIGNKVIDEEFITANNNNFSAVAIYEVENGKIAKVTFLR
ncbi:MAG: nuclear transport factor 2 family protein [Aurantibacter sp.]